MSKKSVLLIIYGLAIFSGIIFIVLFGVNKPSKNFVASSPKDATYFINNVPVTLRDGRASVSNGKDKSVIIKTDYFGNEVVHDFDGDGRNDTAFILTQSTGGEEIFYYVVVALNTVNGYVGSHSFFLGDRIAPQSTTLSENKNTPNIIIVNYADRKYDESFSIQPSVGKSVQMLLDPKNLEFGEVVKNFEGEADPKKMSLTMKQWNWETAQYSNGSTTKPKTPNKFVITFTSTSKWSASTDCNSLTGEYTVKENKISFKNIVSTRMYCEGSQEQDFIKMIEDVQSYFFTSKGELVMEFKYDSGSMIFR